MRLTCAGNALWSDSLTGAFFMRSTLTTLLAVLLFASSAAATNNYFLPGDAFFSIALSREKMKKWKESSEDGFEFFYERFDDSFFACGNIGYSTLVMEGIGPEMRRALVAAYDSYAGGIAPVFREDQGNDGRAVMSQINSVVALIYHKSYDLDWGLGLKFNEKWAAQGGHQYAGFLTSAKAVVEDWRNAFHVAPLAVRERLDPEAHLAANYEVARTQDDPLHISSDDVQIVLVGFAETTNLVAQRCANLQAVFDDEQGARYLVVTKGLVREFEYDEAEGWKQTALEVTEK